MTSKAIVARAVLGAAIAIILSLLYIMLVDRKSASVASQPPELRDERESTDDGARRETSRDQKSSATAAPFGAMSQDTEAAMADELLREDFVRKWLEKLQDEPSAKFSRAFFDELLRLPDLESIGRSELSGVPDGRIGFDPDDSESQHRHLWFGWLVSGAGGGVSTADAVLGRRGDLQTAQKWFDVRSGPMIDERSNIVIDERSVGENGTGRLLVISRQVMDRKMTNFVWVQPCEARAA